MPKIIFAFAFFSGFISLLRGQSFLTEADKQFLKQPHTNVYVDSLNKLADKHYLSEPLKTNLFSSIALSIADSLHYQKGMADAYVGKSLMEQLNANYGAELEWQLKALKIYEELNDLQNLSKTYSQIGVIHFHQGNTDLSKSYYEKALAIFKSLHDTKGEASTFRRMGNLSAEGKDVENALRLYQTALSLEEKINNETGIANTLNNIGVVYYDAGNYEQALRYYNRSLTLIQKINNLNRLSAAYHNISRVYLKQNKTDEALVLAEKSMTVARKMNQKAALLEGDLLLSEIYAEKKMFDKAYLFLGENKKLQDSIREKESSLKIARLETLIDTERNEKQIALLNKEKEAANFRQRIILSSLGLVVLIGGLVIYTQRTSLRRKHDLIKKGEELLKTQQILSTKELENKALVEDQLKQDLEFRHKELLTYTLNLVQKNALMENIRESIQEVMSATDKDSKIQLPKLIKLIDYSLESEKDWEEFKMYFEKVHSSFFENMKLHFPDLNQSDLKLCALVSLNLSMKEMAELMGISPESVKMARHRLRKKLDIASDENLADFLAGFKTT
jgi:tetratricopeptide (TPR) repeat protein/DNA-binding CsgD family transcriptional regulator